jgi:penicillin-binding protein 1A
VRRLSWLIKLPLIIVISGLGLAAVTAGIIPQVVEALHAHKQDPISLPSFNDLAQRSYMYDLAGNNIAFFELENSQPVKIEQVPEAVIKSFLAVEDNEFYLHKGVNVRSLARAILADVQTGSSRQGASTITMQLAKLEYLADFEQDARYKLIQARYALMLEKELSKDEILERYLNVVYFGANAYGIQAASEVYFGKQAKDLTMLEGAFLAGLVRAPTSYNPIENPQPARARFKTVVSRLVDVGLLTELESEDAFETFPLPERAQRTPELPSARTHFTNEVKDFLLNRSTILGETYEARFNALFRGGLAIYTTLDPNIQQMATDAKNSQLPQNAAGIEAAMTVLDTTTGAVRAMVGGKEFEKDVNEVNLAFSPRQTGSSIKMFILAAAVQAGAQANDIIDGTKPCELPNPGNPREPFIIKGGVSKAPATLAEMTWSSINCAYARLSQIIGLNRLVISTYRMARSPWLIGDRENDGRVIEAFASYATGANEMSTLDMAAGGQTIANRGLHQEPYIIERIESPRGLVYQHQLTGTQVLDPDVADQTVAILKGVITRGTARRAMDGGLQGGDRPSAGKTGTQDKNTNAWFVGFTAQLTTAVWVGDPNGYTQMDGIPEFVAAGVPKVQGGTFPAKIWKAVMEPAHYGAPVVDWPAPPPPDRKAARLFLPGNECLIKGTPTTVADPNAPPPEAPDPNEPPVTQSVPKSRTIDPGTTVSPDNLDPNAPMPSVATTGVIVYDCKRGPPAPPAPATTAPSEAPPSSEE